MSPPILVRLHGGLACFAWIFSWLFAPWLATFLCWRTAGLLGAGLLWVLLNVCPTLQPLEAARRLIQQQTSWFEAFDVLGDPLRNTSATEPVLFCHHPHGVCAIGASSVGTRVATAKQPCRGVVASLVFRLPICRQLFELVGNIPSDAASMRRAMRDERRDLVIIPGGVEEVVLASPDHERSFLSSRKGFVKYALQFGYDLVPVYHLGETQMFRPLYPQDTSWAVKLRLAIAHKTGIALGIGFGFPLMPLIPDPRARCISIVGERMVLEQISTPTREQVDQCHSEYMNRLRALYEGHRHLHPAYAHKELEIW